MLALLVAAALVSTPPASTCAQDARVRVWLTVDSEWRAAAPAIRAVVANIWETAGLPIEWVDGSARIDLLINIARQLPTKPGVLGEVLFNGDQPRPLARISIKAVREWVDRYRMRLFNISIISARVGDSALVVRVLGYAAAHEMGHFVLATRSHASSGLMRATLADSDVLATASTWTLDAVNRERLSDRLINGPLRNRCDAQFRPR